MRPRARARGDPFSPRRRGRPYVHVSEVSVGSVIKKRRKRMAKKKHRKLLKRTRVQRRNKK
ncbi:30S ribosomal protein bS22 [Yinghuangia sp. YIM S09857]|uniref:30S ribosomal protein bS22 n=1 Tax=Yinghuangia sp. YIM S09857 TaxID=3436929 RepID=UPI003F52969C